MAAVHIRNVPDDVLDALKQRAARHDRSLQEELRHILGLVACEEPSAEAIPALALKLSQGSPTSNWRREEIYGDDGR